MQHINHNTAAPFRYNKLISVGLITFSIAALGMGCYRTYQLSLQIGWQAWALDAFLLGCLGFFSALGLFYAVSQQAIALFACIAAAAVLLVIGGAA